MMNFMTIVMVALFLMAPVPFAPVSSSSAQDEGLVLSTWCSAPISRPDQSGYMDRILIEAFKRNDLALTITQMPAERSLQQANDGHTDGEFFRVSAIGDIYPNLLMVPEPLYRMRFVAFSHRDDVQLVDWASLEPYRVGIVVGWKILEANVANNHGRRSDISKPENMFRMLEANRLDLAIYSEAFGWDIIERLDLNGIKSLAPPLAEKEMYLFLNKQHEQIIPQITETLREMKRDGTFAAIASETLRRSNVQ